jgi:hypothetical protein
MHDSTCFHIKVCELDIIFNYEKAHFIWNEYVIGGELVETSKTEILGAVLNQDDIQIVRPSLYITLCLNLKFVVIILFFFQEELEQK